MKQLSTTKSIFYHLYPGVLITLGFIAIAPLSMKYGYPPQFALLLCILLVALPVIYIHLYSVKKIEGAQTILDLNGLTKRLPFIKLVLYSVGLVIFAFIIWGATQPLDNYLRNHLFSWIPAKLSIQSFTGYSHDKIKITLILNLILNGIVAPLAEEFYFRGYLLPRMKTWGKYAFAGNAVLFSVYHFWQPFSYVTLIFSLIPMTYLVYKTQDIRLGILTHSLMNLIGAILSFGMLK